MNRLTDRAKDMARYLIVFLFVLAGLAAIRNQIMLLFAPDPQVAWTYQYSFQSDQPCVDGSIVECEGFIPDRQGLQLLPSTTGRLVFAFQKQARQGCLLRVWFYGDTGSRRPNAITIFPDGGPPFRLTENENHVGAVFDLSDLLQGFSAFRISFEAENRAPFPARVLDSVELVTGQHGQVKPSLPDLTMVLGLILFAPLMFVTVFSQTLSLRQKYARILLLCILLLACHLRWSEVSRISGTVLDEDARGYYHYAQKMTLAGENGFYSAQFEKREPLFIFMVKLFFTVFGISATHLRFVSFAFSMVVIYLAYRIGRAWFAESVGLLAALILSVHPYLIQLSARGLRAEWFAVLLLLFAYAASIRSSMSSMRRAALCGLLGGCLLLTRSECLPMILLLLLLYPLLVAQCWNYRMTVTAVAVCIFIWIPHQYSIYKQYGDFFYTANQYARFYANREFAGQPGFPATQEIQEKGMYYGPKITPVDYYWRLHTPWQVFSGSLVGFVKIHLMMPLSFLTGRGNAGIVTFAADGFMRDPGVKEALDMLTLAGRLFQERLLENIMGLVVIITFLSGLVFMGMHGNWIMYAYLILFQLHTSFLASLGLDQRLSIHSYPLIALCCGYAIYVIFKKITVRSHRREIAL